eukprot:1741708-Prymnesium_polylepis.1
MGWLLAYRTGLVAVRARRFPWQFAHGREVLAYRAGLVAVRAQGFPWLFALGRGPDLSRRPRGSSRTKVLMAVRAWEEVLAYS